MADDLPRLVIDGFHPAFADFARYMLEERVSVYPRRIAAKLMTEAEAAKKIQIMRAIAEIWACAAEPDYHPDRKLYSVTRGEMVEELRSAREFAETLLAKAPDSPKARDRVDTLTAMLWWHQHYKATGSGRVGGAGVYMLQMILNLRPDAQIKQAEHAQERAAA